MWTRLCIGLMFSATISGCGQAVGEGSEASAESQRKTLDTMMREGGQARGASYSGQLPDAVSAETADLQSRVMAELEAGLPVEIFAGANPSIENSVRVMGATPSAADKPTAAKGRYRLHLVLHNLEKQPNIAASFCESGDLYKAHVAARPYTVGTWEGEALRTTFVSAYGLHICDGEDGLRYEFTGEVVDPQDAMKK